MSAYDQIKTEFERTGARASIRRLDRQSLRRIQRPLAIDIVTDESGEYFDIQLAANVGLAVVDVQRRHRHLLLSAWNAVGEDRFLCGHDEHHWFAAALPRDPDAINVEAAKEALKPERVKRLEQRKHKGKHHRKHDVYLRQGEWFFVPCPHVSNAWNRNLIPWWLLLPQGVSGAIERRGGIRYAAKLFALNERVSLTPASTFFRR